MSDYLPEIAWRTILREVTLDSVDYQYVVKVFPEDPNEPGADPMTVDEGCWVVDYAGYTYQVVNVSGNELTLYDVNKRKWGYNFIGPTPNMEAYVYKPKNGAFLLTQAQLRYLDRSAEDKLYPVEKGVAWAHRGVRLSDGSNSFENVTELKVEGLSIESDGDGWQGGKKYKIKAEGDAVYSEISTGEIDGGTSSDLRAVTGRRMKYAIDKANTFTTNALKDLELGTTNLLVGTRLFSGDSWQSLSYWSRQGIYKGLQVIKNLTAWRGPYQEVYVEAGEEYVFSAYVRVSNQNSTNAGFHSSGGTGTVSIQSASLSTQIDRVNEEWRRIKISFTAITSGTIRPRVGMFDGGNWIELCGYQLEKGLNASDWSPTPLDYELFQFKSKSNSFTLALEDSNQVLLCTGTTDRHTITVPNSSSAPYPKGTRIWIATKNMGVREIRGASGVTVLGKKSIITPNYLVMLVKEDTNTWAVYNGQDELFITTTPSEVIFNIVGLPLPSGKYVKKTSTINITHNMPSIVFEILDNKDVFTITPAVENVSGEYTLECEAYGDGEFDSTLRIKSGVHIKDIPISCSTTPPPFLTVTPQSVAIDYLAQSKVISINTSGTTPTASITLGSGWISKSAVTGSDGSYSVTLTMSKNTTGDNRIGEISVTAGEHNRIITVLQLSEDISSGGGGTGGEGSGSETAKSCLERCLGMYPPGVSPIPYQLCVEGCNTAVKEQFQ